METYMLCPLICDALKECDPYNYDPEFAIPDTMELLEANDLQTIYDHLYSFVEEVPDDDRPILFPCTMDALEELAHFGECE